MELGGICVKGRTKSEIGEIYMYSYAGYFILHLIYS